MPGFDDKVLTLDVPGLPQSSETLLRTARWVQHTYPVGLPRLWSPGRWVHAQDSESEDDDQRECPAYDPVSQRMATRLHDFSLWTFRGPTRSRLNYALGERCSS